MLKYTFLGKAFCVDAFQFIHVNRVGKRKFENLKKHFKTHVGCMVIKAVSPQIPILLLWCVVIHRVCSILPQLLTVLMLVVKQMSATLTKLKTEMRICHIKFGIVTLVVEPLGRFSLHGVSPSWRPGLSWLVGHSSWGGSVGGTCMSRHGRLLPRVCGYPVSRIVSVDVNSEFVESCPSPIFFSKHLGFSDTGEIKNRNAHLLR